MSRYSDPYTEPRSYRSESRFRPDRIEIRQTGRWTFFFIGLALGAIFL